MNKLIVTESSKHLKETVFGNVKQIDGSVLVVFDNSFILRFGIDELFHLTSINKNLSPFSLYVHNLPVNIVNKEVNVCWHCNQFLIGDIFIELNAETQTFNESKLKKIKTKQIKLPYQEKTSSIFSEKFDQYRENLLDSYRNQDFDKCSQNLVKLIGLGDGLTPCGDDYLLGLIYGLKCEENTYLLTLIKHILYRYVSSLTNIISKKFLVYGLSGKFSKTIIEQDWDTLLEYGHNSGYYTLLGISDSVRNFSKNLIVS